MDRTLLSQRLPGRRHLLTATARILLSGILIFLLTACSERGNTRARETAGPSASASITATSASPLSALPPTDPPPIATIGTRPTYPPVTDRWATAQPYPMPTSCPVTLPVTTQRIGPAYWWEGQGIHAGLFTDGLLFVGQNKVLWFFDQRPPLDAVKINGQRLDAAAPPLVATIGEAPDAHGQPSWPSALDFPMPGCWRIHVQAGTQILEITAYVFPEGCRPLGLRNPSASPTPCVPLMP